MSDFYTALSFCHTLQLCLGLADFTVVGPVHDRTLKIFRVQSWYKLTFIFLTVIVTVVFVLLNDVIAPFKSENEFYWFVALYDLHCDYLFMVGLLASSLLFRNDLIESWRNIMTTDKLLHGFQPNTNNGAIKRYSQIWILFHFVCNTLAHFTTDDVVSHQEIKFFLVSNVLYWILNFYRISVGCVFQAWIFSLKLRFQALHEWVLKNQLFITQSEIRQMRLVHQQLCEISSTINKVYSVPILFSLSMDFFIFIFQTYEFLVLVSKRMVYWDQVVNTVVYMMWTGFEIVAVVVSCALTNKHERMLRRRLFGLLNTSPHLRSEVNSFAVQMLHFNSQLTAAGCFVIDGPLLFQIAGTGATYLFIFLQFYSLNN